MPRKRKKRRLTRKKDATRGKFDWQFFLMTLGIVLFGLIMVFDASVFESFTLFGDKFRFLRLQTMWAGVGLIALLTAAFVPLSWVEKLSRPFFAFTLVLLFLVLIPGFSNKTLGARRWLDLGFTSFQPSELAKLATSIYFSSWLAKHQRIGPFMAVLGVLVVLLMLEPDLGTTIVISSIAVSVYFLSGAKLKKLLLVGAAGLLVVSLLIVASPYRRQRLTTFLDPTSDPLGASYHVRQIIIGLGSGGWFGTGIGRSRQKYQYLPEATTDSIFAVMAEEVGFVGASVVVLVYLLLILRGLQQIGKMPDGFARLLASCIITWIAAQSVLNLAAMVILVPLTGIPLPLVSYGGSSLVTMMAGIGLYLNAVRVKRIR